MNNIDFFCFQPVLFDEKSFFKVQTSNFIPKNWQKVVASYENVHCNDILEYIKHMEKHDLYILDDYSQKINIDFAEVDKNHSCYGVFFDKDYKIFCIIYKLSLSLNKNFDNNKLIGLYKIIRDELVFDNAINNNISNWSKQIIDISLKGINKNFTTNLCKIIPNTGYIFSSYSEFKNPNIKNFKNNFLNSNHNIDLIDENKELFESLSFFKTRLNNNSNYDSSPYIFYLGWRFSTIYGIKNKEDLKLIPIFLNLQNIYFQIDCFYEPYLSKLYQDIRYKNDYNTLNDNVEIFDKLEVAFQNLIFEKNKFISELKPLQLEIFNTMEEYWNLNTHYKTIEKNLSIYESSLNRKLNLERNIMQEKQNNILFILAIIQIFSIISISVDFFSLKEINYDKPYNHYQIYLLSVLIVTSISLIIVAYSKQIIYKLKNIFKK